MREWLRKYAQLLLPVFIGVIIGFIAGIFLSTKFNQVKFGDWGEWAGAITTFAAVVVSLRIATENRRPHVILETGIIKELHTLMVYVDNDGSIPIYRLRITIKYSFNGRSFSDLDSDIYNKRILPGQMHAFRFSYPVDDPMNWDKNPYHLGDEILNDSWNHTIKSKKIKVIVVANKRGFIDSVKTKSVTYSIRN